MPDPVSRAPAAGANMAGCDGLSQAVRPRSRSTSPHRAPRLPEGFPESPGSSTQSPLPPRRAFTEVASELANLREEADSLADWNSVRQQIERDELSPSRRLSLARRAALQWPQELMGHTVDDRVCGEADRLALALTAAAGLSRASAMVDASRLVQAFCLDTTLARVQLLSALLAQPGSDLKDCLVRLELMYRPDLALDGATWSFRLNEQPAALAVANSLLDFFEPDPLRPKSWGVPDPVQVACGALDSPHLSKDERIELARRIAQRSDNDSLIERIQSFESPELRKELALLVAQRCESWQIVTLPDLTTDDRRVLVSAQQASRLKNMLANHTGRLFSESIVTSLVAIGIYPTQREHCGLYADGMRVAAEIDRSRGLPMRAVRDALVQLHRPIDVTYVPGYLEEHAESAARLLELPPQLERMMAQARQLPNEEHREDAYEWILTAGFMLADLEHEALAPLAPTLEWLGNVKPPELRSMLTNSLSDTVIAAGVDAATRFTSSGQFHRPHMRAFGVALGRLYAAEALSLPDAMRAALSHSKLKDGKRLQGVCRDVLAIVDSGALPLSERRRLFELSAPTRTTAGEAVEGFMKTLTLLAFVLRAVDSTTLDRDDTRSVLSGVGSFRDLGHALGLLARRATPGSPTHRESDAPNLRANWDRFMTKSRRPEALLAYAELVRFDITSINPHVDSDGDRAVTSDEGRRSLADAIRLFADAVVWSDDPKKAFADLRYDTQSSNHLAEIAQRSPSAWSAWRAGLAACSIDTRGAGSVSPSADAAQYLYQRIVQDAHVPAQDYPILRRVLTGALDASDALRAVESGGQEQRLLQLLAPSATVQERSQLLREIIARLAPGGQFRRDLEDLKGLLDAKPGRVRRLMVVDTDDAEDLLLCGTEIAGSCQSVDDDINLNKALMGYAVDGKYRMLAAKDDTNRLAARRMLRLLLTDDGLPALVMERLYANAGIESGGPIDQAMIDLAKQKALTLGCELLADTNDLDFDGHAVERTVQSIDSRAPFEYVDANGLGVQQRFYEIRAWPVRC